jgi:hypothetical protein
VLKLGGPIFNQPVEGVDDGAKGYGVKGRTAVGSGVLGSSNNGTGVEGRSGGHIGVHGSSVDSAGVFAESINGAGLVGFSSNDIGVAGQAFFRPAVFGFSHNPFGIGVQGFSEKGDAVFGLSDGHSGISVHGKTGNAGGIAVFGESTSGFGVYGFSNSGYGVYCHSGPLGFAAYLNGRTHIHGPLTKPAGSFKIDHPVDPANKYLYHSFVESPDMKNIYDGVTILDYKGEAEIELPDWFGALNKEFRYQLTAIGAPGPNLYIAEEISLGVINYSNNTSSSENRSNSFKIAGGTPGMKVSWNVTGIRKDPWANAHRIQVEEDKPEKERGYYLYPELYDQPAENGISHLLMPEEEILVNENKQDERLQVAN